MGVTAQVRGWQSARGEGWTLWTRTNSPELLREGNTAWGKAEALYPPRGKVQPEVWEYPTTELFRQSTHEPGWMMASTRGTRVSLQPEPLLQSSGREEETLLHEFLHVLVESEASSQSPLWLREGLVEALRTVRARAPSWGGSKCGSVGCCAGAAGEPSRIAKSACRGGEVDAGADRAEWTRTDAGLAARRRSAGAGD